VGGGLRRDPRTDLKRAAVATALLALAVAAGLALYGDVGKVGAALGRFRWELFPLALALTAINYVLRFWRWQLYLRRLRIVVPAGRSFTIFFAGLVGTLSPAKLGEVLKSGLLRRSFGVPVRRSAPIVLVERITDALGIVALAALGGAGVAGSVPVLVAAAGGALALAVLLRTPLLDRFERLAEARGAAAELLGAPLVAGMSALAGASWFCECLAAYVCVRGLGLDISLADTVVAFSAGSLAGALSFLPGGLGVAEAGITGLLQTLAGLSATDATASTVLIRLATLWFAVALGLGALALEQRFYEPVSSEVPAPGGRRSSMR
jgi:glycosyltransferase 2 family protein